MLSRDYKAEQDRASLNHPVDRTARHFFEAKPPTTASEEIAYSFQLGFQDNLTYGIYDLWKRRQDIKSLQTMNPRYKEVLTPEQIAIEYPDSVVPIKSHKTRGEMEIIAKRDFETKKLQQALLGKSKADLPDGAINMIAGMGGAMADPTGIGLVLGTWAFLPAVPAFRNLISLANVAQRTLKSRGAAAGMLAIDGFIGSLIYNTTNFAIQQKRYRPYGMGDVMLETLLETGLGAVLGGAFPKLAAQGEGLFLNREGVPGAVVGMQYLRRILNDPKRRNEFWEFMADEGGAIDIQAILDTLSGKAVKKRKEDLKSRMSNVELRETMFTGVDEKGDVIHRRGQDLDPKLNFYQTTPASVHQLVERKFKDSGKFSALRWIGEGITGFGRFKFRPVKKLYASMMSPTYPSQRHRGKGVDKHKSQFSELFIAFPPGVDITAGRKGEPVPMASSPFGAAQRYLVQANPRVKELRVVAVKFDTGPKGLNFFDMDIFDFTTKWNEFVKRGKADVNFRDASAVMQAAYKYEFIMKSKYLDGLSHKSPLKGGDYDMVDVREEAFQKLKGFSDTYLYYDLKTDAAITQGDIDLINMYRAGKGGLDNPPSVNRLTENFLASFEESEGINLFDTFVKRVDYPSIDEGYNAHIGAYPLMSYGGTAFNPQTPFSTLPKKVWKGIVDAYEEMNLGPLDPPGGKWIENMDSVYSEALGDWPGLVVRFRDILKGKGYRFPSRVHARHPSNKWIVLNDAVIQPLPDDTNITKAILIDGSLDFENVNILMPKRELRLDLGLVAMTAEERGILARLMKEGMEIDIDHFTNTTTIGLGREKLDGFVRAYSKELEKIGVTKIYYKTSSKDAVYTIGKNVLHFGEGNTMLGKTYRRLVQKLESIPEPVDGAKPLPKNEERDAMIRMIERMGYGGQYEKVLALSQDLRTNALGSTKIGKRVDNMTRAFVNAGEAVRRADPGSPKYQKKLRDYRTTSRDIEKTYTILQMMLAGGLDFGRESAGKLSGWYKKLDAVTVGIGTEAPELLNIINYQPERAYEAYGGYNITSLTSSMERQLIVPMFDFLRQEVGDAGLEAANKGLLDSDLFEIKHFVVRKAEEAEGVRGTVLEDGKEQLQVSDTAWKVYNVLVRIMDMSQKMLAQAGFYRKPLKGYIGVRSYDLKRIIRTNRDEFMGDFMARSDASADTALDFYRSASETRRVNMKIMSTVYDATSFMEKERKIRFNSAADELWIMDKYGTVTRSGTDRVATWNAWDLGTSSHIMAGAMQSISNDSKYAGVTSILGTRPFYTLDLADSVLKRKYEEIFHRNGYKIDRVKLNAGVDSSVIMTKSIVQAMLVGQPEGIGTLPVTRRFLRSATNLALLPLVGMNSFIYDAVATAMQMNRFLPEENIATTFAKTFIGKFKYLKKSRQREVAKFGYALLTADTRDHVRRFYGDEAAGLGAWFESFVLGMSGVSRVTDGGRVANTVTMGVWLDQAFKLPWEKLADSHKSLLSIHRIDERMWDWVRSQSRLVTQFEGVDIVTIGEIVQMLSRAVANKEITEAFATRVKFNFDTFIAEHAQTKSIPMQDIYTREFWNFDRDNPESLPHNLGKFASQFRPISHASTRSMADAVHGKVTGQRYGYKVENVGKLMALGFVAGATAIHLNDFARGKEMRDMDSQQFVLEALLRGGVLGIAGDFLVGSHNDREAGYMGNFLGPVISGPGYDAAKAIRQLFLLEPIESWEHIEKVMGHLMPSVWPLEVLLQTAFLKSLGDLSGSPEANALRRRYLQERGSDYYFAN